MAASAADGGRPVAIESLGIAAPGEAVSLEASAAKASGMSALRARLTAFKGYLTAALFHRFMLKAGPFDMAAYVGDIVANADFRKFDDGLRMTLDCSEAFAQALEARLAAAEDFADYGAFRQAGAQVTCSCPRTAIAAICISSTAPTADTPWPPIALKARRHLKATA